MFQPCTLLAPPGIAIMGVPRSKWCRMPGRSHVEFVQTRAIAFFLLVLAPFSCSQEGVTPASHPAPTGTAKNIILFIGDGMGFEQVKAAGMYEGGAAGTLSFEAFPYRGSTKPISGEGGGPDSAASATAMATGNKVSNGVISMSIPGNGNPSVTVLELLKAEGKSTGLVTTTFVTHATAAAFGAHEPDRNNYVNIAGDYLRDARPNVLFGGAKYVTNPAAAAAGYTVVADRAGLQALDTETESMVSGQFGGHPIPSELDGLGGLPHLSEMTLAALHILDNDPDGFFLMVEGGRIDHACHANDIERTIRETIEFSRAVAKAGARERGHDVAKPHAGVLEEGRYRQGGGRFHVEPFAAQKDQRLLHLRVGHRKNLAPRLPDDVDDLLPADRVGDGDSLGDRLPGCDHRDRVEAVPEHGEEGGTVLRLHGDVPGHYVDQPVLLQLPEPDPGADQERSVSRGKQECVWCTKAQLLPDLVGERLRPLEEEGVPGVARIVGRLRCRKSRVRCIFPASGDPAQSGSVKKDLGQLPRRGAFGDEDLAFDACLRRIGGDRATRIPRGVLDDPGDSHFLRLADQHRRSAVLVRPRREELLELEKQAPRPEVDRDQRRHPLLEGHNVGGVIDRHRPPDGGRGGRFQGTQSTGAPRRKDGGMAPLDRHLPEKGTVKPPRSG